MSYTAPAGRYGTTDAEHDAYLAAHSAGWTHANYAAAYGTDETVEQAAVRWGTELFGWSDRSAEYSRAVEGFTDGAEAFTDGDTD